MNAKSIKRKKQKTKAKQDQHIPEPLHSVSWSLTFPTGLLLLKRIGLYILGKEKIETIASDTSHDAKTYIAGYIILTLISSLGMLLYGLLGGARYFNNWYLFLMPIMSIVTTTLLFISAIAVLYYVIWGKKMFTRKKNIYAKYLIAVFIPSQLAWLFYAIKINWTGLNHHISLISIAITSFMFIKILSKNPKEFSASSLLLGIILTAIPYYTLMFYNPKIAAFAVRIFGL